MKLWKELKNIDIKPVGKNKNIDDNIYVFDIETTSYLDYLGKTFQAEKWLSFDDKQRENVNLKATMYIWMFSINEDVYYGRTWDDFIAFLEILEELCPLQKIVFVHNLAFEFAFLQSILSFNKVLARISRKPFIAETNDFNIQFRCSYYLTNMKLALLPETYNLDVEKKVGDLDYTLIRHSETELTEKEMGYCENDCLVVYKYIKDVELPTYNNVFHIPFTSTGHVRREFKEKIMYNKSYKKRVKNRYNTNPDVFNMLVDAFAGGYTHANWLYVDELMKFLTGFDFTSSYPYVLCCFKYPSTTFSKCSLNKIEDMLDNFAYLVRIKIKNVRCRYFNTIISSSKCKFIKNPTLDNGRVISADELELVLTDVDLKLINDWYDFDDDYEILESYRALYSYLPEEYIRFILKKYVTKTQYKDIEDKVVEYNRQKSLFNALFGMTVTNTIRSVVEFNDKMKKWNKSRPMTDEEIAEELSKEKAKGFLSFSDGVWCTAWARNNLLRCVMQLDYYTVYCDTDSIKLIEGYNKAVIENYNQEVYNKIKAVCKRFDIKEELFSPKDVYGNIHTLGLWDNEKGDKGYIEFKTLGAKKYAYKALNKKGKEQIYITISGVPKKSGAKCLDKVDDLKDGKVFPHHITNDNSIVYITDQSPYELEDYKGNKMLVSDLSGVCIVPDQYTLGLDGEYVNVISSMRNKFGGANGRKTHNPLLRFS